MTITRTSVRLGWGTEKRPRVGLTTGGMADTYVGGADMSDSTRQFPGCSNELEERFWSYIDTAGDCWEWTGGTNHAGYGVFFVGRVDGRRRFAQAHRYAWETLAGPIPSGLTLDHLCKNSRCVNPDHLEPVTRAENSRRNWPSSANRRKTHCKWGHPFDEENTYWRNGNRGCLTCRRRRSAEYNAQVRAGKGPQ
jgi:hypothetical protein